ncbi:MAG: pyocin knob domain-containing protein, partial [Arcobacter sp.]
RVTLDTLGISNIAGLQTALNTKLNASAYTAADVLVKIKSVDGPGSGLDADTLDGYEGAYLAGLNYGASNVDPNTATMPYILTNHANSPSTPYYWHIRTQFYSSISSTSNRAQIAIQYNGGNQVYARSCYAGTWTAWVRLDNNDSSLVRITSGQTLHATDPLRISGNTLYLYKGSGAYDSVALPPNTGVGISQTWQAVTKTSGVTYTNSTENPIQLNVWKSPASSGTLTITVAGVLVAQSYYQNYGNGGVVGLFASAVIPAGAAYIISGHSVAVELR